MARRDQSVMSQSKMALGMLIAAKTLSTLNGKETDTRPIGILRTVEILGIRVGV
jgi:hypothetical protein